MTYYNNVSSYKFLVLAVICYIIFFSATIFVLTSDFATRDFIKAKIVKLNADNEYLVNIDGVQIKDASLIIVTGNKIKIYDYDETCITPTTNGQYTVFVSNKRLFQLSQADLLYIFPHNN